MKYKTMEKRNQEVSVELKSSKDECITLQKKLYALENNSQEVEKIAREKFNYCKPNETVYKFKGSNNK